MRACDTCGNKFEGDGRQKRFCQKSCRIAYHNSKWFEYGEASRKKNPCRQMLRSAKHRAKRDNLPFDLELSDLVMPDVCPILGITLASNAGNGGVAHGSPSLDKVVPELGYVKGNVQIVSNLANLVKSDTSPEQMILFAEWVFRTYKGV